MRRPLLRRFPLYKELQRDAVKDLPTRVDLANLKVDLVKWMIGIGLTGVGLVVAFIKLL